jgi:hypothetical protein
MVDEKSSILIENNGELLLGKKVINRYHLVAFYLILGLQKITYIQDKYKYI